MVKKTYTLQIEVEAGGRSQAEGKIERALPVIAKMIREGYVSGIDTAGTNWNLWEEI